MINITEHSKINEQKLININEIRWINRGYDKYYWTKVIIKIDEQNSC